MSQNIITTRNPDSVTVIFEQSQLALSSAVLNGGIAEVRSLLNLKVDKDAPPPFDPPEKTLQEKADELGLSGPVLGMMTAAWMESLAQTFCERTDEHGNRFQARVWVTSGLSNLMRAGDPADQQPVPGTINIWLHCSHFLTPAAMAEALILLTEAKTTVIRDKALKSAVTDSLASGTGTDSHAVICPVDHNQSALEYCGKHTLMGECIGHAVIEACEKSFYRP